MFKILKRERIAEPEKVPELINCIDLYNLKVLKIGIDGDYKSLKMAQYELGSECNLTNYIYIELKETVLEITTKFLEPGRKACTYKISLDRKDINESSGLRYFVNFQHYFKVPKLTDKPQWIDPNSGKFTLSASPILGYNKKFEKQELKDCYEYDLNSAYASVMMDKIPDIDNPIEGRVKVEEGEVGFIYDEHLTLVKGGIGETANIKFKLIDAPEGLKRFATKYYNIKKTEKALFEAAKIDLEHGVAGAAERVKQHKQAFNEAKYQLNLPIGYCQRHNPFFRAYIVNTCNEKIKSIIDKDTLFWNTDAIFSRVKRTDLDIGDNIGQFKEIHCNTLRYIGNNYQVDDELPTYRGVPKKWIEAAQKKSGKKYNLLTDPIPPKENVYKWNWQTLELEKNELWQEE